MAENKDRTLLGITFVDVTDPKAVAKLIKETAEQFPGRFTMEPVPDESRSRAKGHRVKHQAAEFEAEVILDTEKYLNSPQ